MTPSADDRIAEIEARTNAATPAPWFSDHLGLTVDAVHPVRNDATGKTPLAFVAGYFGSHAQQLHNAVFIANARQDIPWLIAELRAARRLER